MKYGVLCLIAACGGSVSTVDATMTASPNEPAEETASGSGSGSAPNDVADGGAATDAATATATDAASEDASTSNPSGCLRSFTSTGDPCTLGTTCSFPEGTCTCVTYCGGPPPPPELEHNSWSCAPKRTDGCPDVKPEDGNACKRPSASCTYTQCCTQTFACTKAGAWKAGELTCPP